MNIVLSKPPSLEVSRHGNVAVVCLCKPADATNALGISLLHELQDAVTQVGNDSAVNLLVLTAKGRSFSAGVDTTELDTATADQITAILHTGQALVRQIMDLDVITLAAINGLAIGGGLELALACDIRWAHKRAVLGLPETKLGLLPGWGGLSLLWRAVPQSLCVEMVTGGECISARRAYEAGLVSRIFEGRDFQREMLAEAQKLAGLGEAVLRNLKALVKRERAPVDLTVADAAFLPLWNARP